MRFMKKVMSMKRPWTEKDNLFFLTVALAAFLTFCISLPISMEMG